MFKFAILAVILVAFNEVNGHGMMLDPPSRSSRWRSDSSAPANYDDMGIYCGGFNVQWNSNGGKCGWCGDNYADARPRANELGGRYGQGVITKTYVNQGTMTVGVQVTANHLGYFYFNLCNLDKAGGKESDGCFDNTVLKFADGSDKQYIGSTKGMIYSTLVLPPGLSCKHCVLRWNYNAGNNWGTCADGSVAPGCGAQENFKGCADISIQGGFRGSDDISIDIPE